MLSFHSERLAIAFGLVSTVHNNSHEESSCI
jgi:hypothetical protein